MVALVWQKAIRHAAAPMNAFAVYYDRDDLNVSKREQRNGEAPILFSQFQSARPGGAAVPCRHVRVATAAGQDRVLAFLGGCQLKFGLAVRPEVGSVANTIKQSRVSPKYSSRHLFMHERWQRPGDFPTHNRASVD
jgi:hypothetical protein